MKHDQADEPNYSKPVAYDAEGRPLYAHPPTAAPVRATTSSHVTAAPATSEGENFDPRTRVQYSNEPDVAHITRPYDPAVLDVSERSQKKHDESITLYPYLNLSKGEYVILNIQRHPIGLVLPVGATALLVSILLAVLMLYPSFVSSSSTLGLPSFGAIVVPILLVAVLALLGGIVTIWVYLQNQFFLTNESVIQEIQHSLFSRHEQTVSLGSIEDASFKQTGVFQSLFDYGTIRLSTEGEETTYRFAFVARPKEQVAIVNNAVEAFKNGRPVDPTED